MGPQHEELLLLGDAVRIRNVAFGDPLVMQGVVARVGIPADSIPVFESVVNFATRCVQNYKAEVSRVITTEKIADYASVQSCEQVLVAHQQTAKAVEAAWSNIKSADSIGRIHQAKSRSDLKAEMDKGLRDSIDMYGRRSRLQLKLKEIVQRQEADIMSDSLSAVVARRENDKVKLLQQQIDVLEKDLGISRLPSKDVRLVIPARLHDGMKGGQLVANIDSFVAEHRNDMPLSRHFIRRIGHDLHPDTALFWGVNAADSASGMTNAAGIFTVLPTEANNWAGLQGEAKVRYLQETGWLWNVWVKAFQEAGATELLYRILQPFQCGLYHDETAVGARGDGVLAYWCLLSMTRPADEQHRTEVEEWLNTSYLKLWQNNVAWDVVMKEIT